jgi:hypothetical protein
MRLARIFISLQRVLDRVQWRSVGLAKRSSAWPERLAGRSPSAAVATDKYYSASWNAKSKVSPRSAPSRKLV